MRASGQPDRRPGYVLVVVLLVVVVLSLAAYRFAQAMSSEAAVAARSAEAARVKAFAASGVHYAAGALADPNTMAQITDPSDAGALFSGIPVGPTGGGSRGGGQFTLFAVADTFAGTGEARYVVRPGVTDESGKLNINAVIQLDPTGQVLHDALMTLPNMTENVADAIVDWVDADDTPRANGAESAVYSAANPTPYAAKNGPLTTLDELLLVQGVTPQLLYGNDRNRNGRLDPGEDDGNDFNRGWSEFLTVYGRELDADSNGNPRINLNDTTTDAATQYQNLVAAVGQGMADYILFYRMGGQTGAVNTTTTTKTGDGDADDAKNTTTGTTTGTAAQLTAAVQQMLSAGKTPSKQMKSVFDVYNTQATLPKPANARPTDPAPVFPCPLNSPGTLNALLPKLLDLTTARSSYEIVPRVNVNTAPPEVLTALPGLAPADVTSIVAARAGLTPGDPATTTGAWLVTQGGVKASAFQKLEKYVTGRSQTYRVQSVGYFAKGGPVARAEAVIDTNQGHPRIVYYRDLTDLGRGFDLPR